MLDKKIANIENHITEYLSYLDKEDEGEAALEDATKVHIQEAIRELKERKGKYIGYKNELKESGESQLLTTDPDARRMHSKDGFHCSYNAQTAVDDGSHMIAGYTVTNNIDVGNLKSVSDEARKAIEVNTIEALADKGYDSNKDVLNCLMNGIVANPALKEEKEDHVFNIEYIGNDIDEETRKSTEPEDIKKCLHAGVLPECYEGKSVTVEYQKADGTILSCFTLDEGGKTVTCPMGETLYKTRKRGNQTYYSSKPACRFCTNKCTKSKFKVVAFGPGKKYVPVRMNKCETHELPLMPDDVKLPNNFKKTSHSKVLIRITHTDEMTTKRMCLSEHPFGTVKWHNFSHYLLCRGKDKVTAEIGLSFLAYNIRRAINMIGVKEIVDAL